MSKRKDSGRQGLLKRFADATIRAAMASDPAVMQASGWDYDRNGNLVQGDPNAEGATALRNSLAVMSSIPNAVMGAGLAAPMVANEAALVGGPGLGRVAANAALETGTGLLGFEAVDRMPYLWNGPRLSHQASDIAESGVRAVMPDGRAEDIVAGGARLAAPLLVGLPEGVVGAMAGRAGAGVMGNAVGKVANAAERRLIARAEAGNENALREFAKRNNLVRARDTATGETIFFSRDNGGYGEPLRLRNGRLVSERPQEQPQVARIPGLSEDETRAVMREALQEELPPPPPEVANVVTGEGVGLNPEVQALANDLDLDISGIEQFSPASAAPVAQAEVAAAASASAPERTAQEILQHSRLTGGGMSELADRVHSIVGDHASNIDNLSFEQLRDLNRALTSLSRDEGMEFSAAYTYDNPQVLRGAIRGRYSNALDDHYMVNSPQFSSLDEAAEALNEASLMRAYGARNAIEDYLTLNSESPLRSAILNNETIPSSIPNHLREDVFSKLVDSGAMGVDHPLVASKLGAYESDLRQMPTEQIFYEEFVPKYSSRHAYDNSEGALYDLTQRYGTRIKDDPAQRRQQLKAIIDKYGLDKEQTKELIKSMPWNEEYVDYKGLIDLVSGNVPLGAQAKNDLRAIVKSAYSQPSFYTPRGINRFEADIAEKVLRERIPGLPDTPLSTVRDAYAPGYIDLAKSLREAGLAEMPSDVSGLSWFQVQQALSPSYMSDTPLQKAIAEWRSLRDIPQARQRVDLQTRLLKAATPRETGVFEPHSSVDSYNVLGKNALPTGNGTYGPGVTSSTYGLGPNDVSLVQIPVNKYGFDSVDLYERGNNLQLNGLVAGKNNVVSNTSGKPLFSIPNNGYQLINDAMSSSLTPREYMAQNPDTRTLVDNIIGNIRGINKVDVDRTAGVLKRVNMQNKKVGAPLVDAPVYNTYYTSENPLFYEDGNYADMLGIAKEFLGQIPFGKYSTYMQRSPIMSLRHKSGGPIHIDPSKRGTFKAQASRMGMGVKEAANYIHAHPDNFSAAMRKKANFARNFAADGGPIWSDSTPDTQDWVTRVKVGKRTYNYEDRTDLYDKDRYYDVVQARYNGLVGAMKRAGMERDDIDRLAPFTTVQNVLEGGWRVNKPERPQGGGLNNFGGMRGGDHGFQNFETPEEYYDAYLANLDDKWGDERLGEGNGWRNAQSLDDFARIIQNRDLNLTTKPLFDEYNKKHPDNPAYIYTPLWENNGTDLMSPQKFGGITDRVNAYIELLKRRNYNRAGGLLDRLKAVYGDNPDEIKAAILRAKNVKKQ